MKFSYHLLSTPIQSLLAHTKTLQLANKDINRTQSQNSSTLAKKNINALTMTLWVVFLLFVFSGAAIAGAVKWNPGHYFTILSWGKTSPSYMANVYNDLENTPALKGIQIRYEWQELETAKGVYDFSTIDNHLNELAKRGKRLVILMQTKSFNSVTPLVPDYLKTEATYEGGIFDITMSNKDGMTGYNIKLWNTGVRYRLIMLLKALGERYNSHPYFEGIGLIETAMGQPVVPLTSTQITDYFNNLIFVNQKMRNFFPNTMTFQFANYPRPILESFVGNLTAMGTAIGGPDTFIDEPGLNYKGTPKGIYNYYSQLSGTIPLAPSVMPDNYRNTRGDGTGYVPTVTELLTFARDTLKANYIFWTRDQEYYPLVLELLSLGQQASNPAGGLNTACPTAYSSCTQ